MYQNGHKVGVGKLKQGFSLHSSECYLQPNRGITKHPNGSPTKMVCITPQTVLQQHLCFDSVYIASYTPVYTIATYMSLYTLNSIHA